jgi:hypothetical protein
VSESEEYHPLFAVSGIFSEKAETYDLTISFSEKEWNLIKSTLENYDHKNMTKDEIVDRLKFWACKSIDSNIRSLNTPIGYGS